MTVIVKRFTDAPLPELGRPLAPGDSVVLKHHPSPGADEDDDDYDDG